MNRLIVTANGDILFSLKIWWVSFELNASAEFYLFGAYARLGSKPILTIMPAEMDGIGGYYRFFWLAFSWSPTTINIYWGRKIIKRIKLQGGRDR